MGRFFFQGQDLMYTPRDGGEKVAIFYDGDFLRALLEGNFECNLNGWTPDEVIEALMEEEILPGFFQPAKEAYAKLWWACNSSQKAGANTEAAYNAAVTALIAGDIQEGTPVYIAQRCDVKKSSQNPFGNEEGFGGDRWGAKGINVMSHRDHVNQYAENKRVAGTDLPPGVKFRDVEVIISGYRFRVNPQDDLDINVINKMWDRVSDTFYH